eukprot:g17899.t1
MSLNEEATKAGVLTVRDAKRFGVHLEKTCGRKKKRKTQKKSKAKKPSAKKTSGKAKPKPKAKAKPVGPKPKEGAAAASAHGGNAKPGAHTTTGCVIGGVRARLKWTLQMITGRRGIDVRLLRINDVELNEEQLQARIRIGDAKLVHRKNVMDVVRGKLEWLTCSTERDAMQFLVRGMEEIERRAESPDSNTFPYKEMVPLKAIAVYTGHKDLQVLKEYIECGADFVAKSHRKLKF